MRPSGLAKMLTLSELSQGRRQIGRKMEGYGYGLTWL